MVLLVFAVSDVPLRNPIVAVGVPWLYHPWSELDVALTEKTFDHRLVVSLELQDIAKSFVTAPRYVIDGDVMQVVAKLRQVETVPDPMIEPAQRARVLAAWAIRVGKSKVMSTPASGAPKG